MESVQQEVKSTPIMYKRISIEEEEKEIGAQREVRTPAPAGQAGDGRPGRAVLRGTIEDHGRHRAFG